MLVDAVERVDECQLDLLEAGERGFGCGLLVIVAVGGSRGGAGDTTEGGAGVLEEGGDVGVDCGELLDALCCGKGGVCVGGG